MDNFVLLGILVLIVQATIVVSKGKLEDKIDKVIKLLSEDSGND